MVQLMVRPDILWMFPILLSNAFYTNICIYFCLSALKLQNFCITNTCGGTVGWGTALQTDSSRVRFQTVSLEFFIYIFLPVAPWPWGRLSLYQKRVPRAFPRGVKEADTQRWQTCQFNVQILWKSGRLNLLEPLGSI